MNIQMTVKEELLDLVALKDTTRGIDIKNSLDTILSNTWIPPNNLVSQPDGEPTMICKNISHVGLLKTDPQIPDFLSINCIIHRKLMIAKYFKYKNVIKIVLKIVKVQRTIGNSKFFLKRWISEIFQMTYLFIVFSDGYPHIMS